MTAYDYLAAQTWGNYMLPALLQVTLLWFFGFWCLGYFVLPGTLSLFGLDKDDLSITKQALYHVVFDVCQLGLTVRILCQQLKAFRPRQKGWFKTQFRPLQAWLVPVCFAAIFFPILDWVARISVVSLAASTQHFHMLSQNTSVGV